MNIYIQTEAKYYVNYCTIGSDVNVYMRRGQFYDKPDLLYPKRRMGDDENGNYY